MKVLITAPRGKMGKLIVKAAAESDDLDIIGVLGPKGREYIGIDAGQVAEMGRNIGVPVSDDLDSIIENCDAIIDFSTVELSMAILDAAAKHRKALVCGTTGFNEEQQQKITEAAQIIPLLHSSNTSYVVNLMNQLLTLAAKALEGRADIEIIEMHDAKKKDAPSGTSKEMAEAMAEGLGRESYEEWVKFHSIRAGDISSSHTVLFGCMGERLEITHHAHNWECFAHGACDAARYLKDKGAGLYTMKDVVG